MATATPPVIRTLADLVRINSVNPAYGGGGSELPMTIAIREFFRPYPVEIWQQEVFPDRPNLIVCLPGRDRNRRVILEAHTDTVSVAGMTIEPFEPTIRNGKLYGRGSCDTKAGLAAMMHALATLAADRDPPPCDIWLAATVDEEFSYRGVVKLCEGLQAVAAQPAVTAQQTVNEQQTVAAIVAEPTDLRAVIASKGVLRWPIRTLGTAAHSAKPQLGNNAIGHMATLIAALDRFHATLADQPAHPLLGQATANIGVIRGGTQVNLVPDHCVIEIDRRLLPGDDVNAVLAQYQQLIDQLASRDPRFHAEILPPLLVDQPLDTAAETTIARVACEVLRQMNLNEVPCGVPYGSDASKLAAIGIPSIVFGPGSIDRAHAAVEYVEIDQVEQALEFYVKLLRRFPSSVTPEVPQ